MARTVVRNISQLLTMATGLHDLRSPHASRILGLVEHAALVTEDGRFLWVGPEEELPDRHVKGATEVDAEGRVVMPGLVECHTHLVFGGNRAHEFELRAKGASYEEIAQAGGGIANTVRSTRTAGVDELFASGMARLDAFARMGVTTVEVKSGYGLDTEAELKMLRVARTLGERHALDVVPTFLGAHVVPPEYRDQRDRYVDLVCNEMIPAVADEKLSRFCDVFCEEGAFSVAESRRVLEAGIAHGLRSKVHAEQLGRSGGAVLAAEMEAVSADHLDHAKEKEAVDMAHRGVVAVLLPGATFFLGKGKYPDGRMLVDAGCAVALSTDYNPGSSHTRNLWLTGTMGCTQCGLLPSQSLWAITQGAARALAMQAEVGAIARGQKADYLVLNTADWQEVLYLYGENPVDRVFKDGVELTF